MNNPLSAEHELILVARHQMGQKWIEQIEQAKAKCKDSVKRIGIHVYVVVLLESNLLSDGYSIEEMGRIAGNDPEEIKETLKLRAARTYVLLDNDYIKAPQP